MKKRKAFRTCLRAAAVIVLISCFGKAPAQPPAAGHFPHHGQSHSPITKITPDELAERESKLMKKKLKLKKEQFERVKAINSVYAYKRNDYENAISSGDARSRKQLSEKLAALEKDKEAELQKVFTPKQFETYLARKSDWQKELNAGPANTAIPPPAPDHEF